MIEPAQRHDNMADEKATYLVTSRRRARFFRAREEEEELMNDSRSSARRGVRFEAISGRKDGRL